MHPILTPVPPLHRMERGPGGEVECATRIRSSNDVCGYWMILALCRRIPMRMFIPNLSCCWIRLLTSSQKVERLNALRML